MPVIGHQAEREELDAELAGRLDEDVNKRLIVSGFAEDRRAAVAAVHDVLYHSGRGDPLHSGHWALSSGLRSAATIDPDFRGSQASFMEKESVTISAGGKGGNRKVSPY